MKREHSLDIKIKGVDFRIYYNFDNEEIEFLRMYKLPMLKLLKENKDGDFVINVHDNTSIILVRRTTIIQKIKDSLL